MDYKKIIIEYQEFIKNIDVITRDYRIEPQLNYVITGVRRAGKTWFLFQIIKEYYENKYENILYINFEDERFIGFTHRDFDQLLSAYYELYPGLKPVLFLDEIQIVDGWQNFCRRVADQKYKIYITGSNAKMLSSDIASTLGGRFMTMEITPLSFKEYLYFKDIHITKNDIYSKKINIIKNNFSDYFNFGGFPEVLNVENKRNYLHNIFTTVFYNDIIAKNKIRNIQGIKLLIKKIAESTNDELSYNRIKNLLKASGVTVGTSTIISWVETLKDSFLIKELQNINYHFSERESKKKYYFIDNGLLFALGVQSPSKLLETLTYNFLNKTSPYLMFYKTTNFEIDFIISEKSLIQVSYTIDNDLTLKRESKALIKAGKHLGISNLYIITYDTEKTFETDEQIINIIPVWKVLLEPELIKK